MRARCRYVLGEYRRHADAEPSEAERLHRAAQDYAMTLRSTREKMELTVEWVTDFAAMSEKQKVKMAAARVGFLLPEDEPEERRTPLTVQQRWGTGAGTGGTPVKH